MKPKSLAYEIWATLLASLLLTACVSVLPAPKVSLSLYQPPVLRLQAGVTVQTKDGTYCPASDEVWQSDARYRALEQEALNLSAALTQLKAGTP